MAGVHEHALASSAILFFSQ